MVHGIDWAAWQAMAGLVEERAGQSPKSKVQSPEFGQSPEAEGEQSKVQSPRSKRKRQRGITVTGFSTTFLLFRLQRGRAGNPNSHHRGALSTTKSKSEVRRPRSEMGSRGRMGRMGESGTDRERARQAGWRREMGGWRKGGDFPCLARRRRVEVCEAHSARREFLQVRRADKGALRGRYRVVHLHERAAPAVAFAEDEDEVGRRRGCRLQPPEPAQPAAQRRMRLRRWAPRSNAPGRRANIAVYSRSSSSAYVGSQPSGIKPSRSRRARDSLAMARTPGLIHGSGSSVWVSCR